MVCARELTRTHEKFIPCIPPRSTYQSGNTILRKNGRPFVGKNSKGRQVAHELYIIALMGKPVSPFNNPISLTLSFCFPYKKSESKKNKDKKHLPHIVRPDLDNLAKGMLDAMQKANYFKDDSIINELRLTKCYHERAGIYINIREFNYM